MFRLHFRLNGECRQVISTAPDADQAIEGLAFLAPDAFLTHVEDLGLRGDFTDEVFARLTEMNGEAKYGLPRM
ncbi:MAG TPA: hypothetical protein VH601_22600 [Bryobacteraceae bacterium]